MWSIGVGVSKHEGKNFRYVILFHALLSLLDDPIGQHCVSVSADHASCRSLSEWPFGHVSSLPVDEDNAHGDVGEPVRVLEQNPGELRSVHIPDRHISIDVTHAARLGFDRAIVPEGEVLAIGILKDRRTQQRPVYRSVYFGLVDFAVGHNIEPLELSIPSLSCFFTDLLKRLALDLSLVVHFRIFDADV